MNANEKANQEAEDFVLENELPRATPTIQKAVADILDAGWHPYITNICGSFAGFKVIEHEACAAIDIAKRDLPDPIHTKKYLESLDLVCESHWNYSGELAPDDEPDSHFHCVDIWWLAQERGFDIGALAKAVAMHETADCTKGSASLNNCFGIKRNHLFVEYETKEESYKDFMVTWLKYYKNLPDQRAAERWSGNDRSEVWLKNVNSFYYDQI